MNGSARQWEFLLLSVVVSAMLQPPAIRAGEGLGLAGPEIWVSGPATVPIDGTDRFPDVAVDDLGRRIHVWRLFDVDGGIALRRFDADGNPLEDPRIVDTTDVSTFDRPRVAVAGDGSFLVIWQSSEDDGGSNRRWIRARAYGANGAALGSDFLVSSESSGTASVIGADLAALRTSDGSSSGWIVVWQSENGQSDMEGSSIQGRLISAAGVPTGSQIEVNNVTSGSQRLPAVTELVDGGFFVVWLDFDLHGRRFTSAGAPVGSQFQINTAFSGVIDEPDAAIGWGGRVAVVWEDFENSQPPGSFSEIRARLFSPTLVPLGADFRVNTAIDNAQVEPHLADLGPKGFMVTWESFEDLTGTDTADQSVQARIITGQNTFDGPQVQYNVFETNAQEEPASHGWYGRAASAWRSIGNSENDMAPFGNHITGRFIEYCLFCDDFEWHDPPSIGSLWRWSGTLGAN